MRINYAHFMPDVPRLIPIERFSYGYLLSNTLNNVKRKYEFFKKDSVPTFFKIQGNDIDYRAKLIRSTILYTDVPYLAIVESRYLFPQSECFPSGIEASSTFRFETMGRKFISQTLMIKSKTADVDFLFSSWGYQVEASEMLTLLWPPAAQINEISMIKADDAFLFSSFNLEPHGNINVHSTDISRVERGIAKVSVKSRVKVYRKNAEIIIEAEEPLSANYDALPIKVNHSNLYKVQDNSTYFFFNRSGAMPISKGQSVMLTPGSSIRCYDSGYLNGTIYPMKQNELSGELLLNDLLAHYKRAECFPSEEFDSLELSDTVAQYIAGCCKSGTINSAAKRFIEEGQL